MISDLERVLAEQQWAWNQRPLLRELYGDWFRRVAAALSEEEGRSIELGSGIGRFHAAYPAVEATDVVPTRWTRAVADAESLPYGDAAVANLVLIDVFHHLARPARFLDEASRVLVPGGRVVILDPYCSALSTVAYRLFHHERTDLSGAVFEDDPRVAAAPLASNQARATLAFFRGRHELERRWPELALVARERVAFLGYPLSGGFTGRQLLPAVAHRPIAALERHLRPLGALVAFRCLVVLERSPAAAPITHGPAGT